MEMICPKSWLTASIASAQAGVVAKHIELTPHLAKELLDRNPDNRSITEARVQLYATDIMNGRWAENGESIVVSKDGLLNDGQHRCLAVIRTGIPINVIIVFGVERETRRTTNQGKAKGAGDYAAMDGISHANIVASCARFAVAYFELGNINNVSRVSNAAALSYIDMHKDALVDAAIFSVSHTRKNRVAVAPSPFAFCFYLCSMVHKAAAAEFFHAIGTGEMLAMGDPAFAVRNKLQILGRTGRHGKIEAILHGWNAYRRGEKRTFIRVQGALPELV